MDCHVMKKSVECNNMDSIGGTWGGGFLNKPHHMLC